MIAWVRRGTPEKRTGFKGTKASRLQDDLDGEHTIADFWTFTLQKITHGLELEDSSNDDEEGADDDLDQMEIDSTDEKAMKRSLRAPGVRSLDADTINQLVGMLALPSTEGQAVNFRLSSDINWGPYGTSSEFGMLVEARQRKRMHLLPYQLPIGSAFPSTHAT